MNHAKKLISGLLSVVMLLVMATTAFAANTNDGSITIRNATVDQTYSIYKVFDLTQNGNNVAYTYTKDGESDTFFNALQENDSPFTLATTTVANKYNVTLKDGKDASAVSTWLQANESKLTQTAEKKATESTVSFENLPYGYYYVKSSLGSIVTLDSTLKDVKVVDKNQGPSWDNKNEESEKTPGKVIVNADGSKVTTNSANYGDEIKFSVAVNAVSYAKNPSNVTKLVTYYHIKDTLSNGFDAAKNIEVKVGGKTLANTEYTLTQNGKEFTVDVPFGEKYGSNAVIEVTYSAVVNNKAALAGDGNLNTANFTYSTDNDSDPSNPSYDPKDPTDPSYPKKPENPTYNNENTRTTTTYVYALGIKKVDPQGNALEGAEFSVSLGDKAISAKQTADGVYEYCAEGTEGAVQTFTTDNNGILIIKGLTAGDYSVKETKAPDGYNLLDEAKTVSAVIDNTSSYTTKITTYKDADGNVTSTQVENGTSVDTDVSANVVPLVVVNKAGTELPSTGGMGTTLFYALGGALVTGAAILLVVKKRMNRSSQ